jgi:hypothetical protein
VLARRVFNRSLLTAANWQRIVVATFHFIYQSGELMFCCRPVQVAAYDLTIRIAGVMIIGV